VDDVVGFLKKELSKTLDQDYELNMEYRQLLIQSIHSCAIKFSEVAASVVHVLMEFLGDSNNPSAVDVIAFVRYALLLTFLLAIIIGLECKYSNIWRLFLFQTK